MEFPKTIPDEMDEERRIEVCAEAAIDFLRVNAPGVAAFVYLGNDNVFMVRGSITSLHMGRILAQLRSANPMAYAWASGFSEGYCEAQDESDVEDDVTLVEVSQ